ncbi:hypothetical protein D3C78_795850 [compost metagenome]
MISTSAISARALATSNWLARLSSTYSTRGKRSPALRRAAPAAAPACSSALNGSSTQKVLPIPGSLLKPMRPCISSASSRLSTRPMPVPLIALFSRPRRWNGWNSWSWRSASMPWPVSSTISRRRSPLTL